MRYPSVMLTDSSVAWAKAVTALLLRNVKERGYKQTVHTHKLGDAHQKLMGSLGEAGFFQWTHATFPRPEDHVRKFKGEADCLGRYEIRAVTHEHYRLLLQPSDEQCLGKDRIFVNVMTAEDERHWKLLRWIPVDEAWALKKWDLGITEPCDTVQRHQMRHGATLCVRAVPLQGTLI